MDQKPPADAAHTQGSLQAQHGDYSPPRARRPGRRQKRKTPTEEPIELLLKTVGHWLNGFTGAMNRLADPRKVEQSRYTQAHLLWLGILLFMEHLGSRRQLRMERESDTFEQNLRRLAGPQIEPTVADPDTLAYYAERISLEDMEPLLAYITRKLIRCKALDLFRLDGYFTVAIDGSQICTFDKEPWPGCPHRKLPDGSIQYFAYVLDAKLVTPCGMALTLATEMLTNEGNEIFDKQDCELKAFPRLAEKLYRLFPRTPFCLLLDGLYANQNVLRLLKANSWRYFITFKVGSMSERFAEATSLADIQKKNRLRVKGKERVQRFKWTDALPVAEFTPNVLFCHDINMITGKTTDFVWLTNFHLCANNVERMANKGGRLRWKIENEGFNVQKHNGYEMEHPYSEHHNGFRIFYILLLIAHYMTQLILHGSLIRSLAESFGTAKNFAKRLAESMRNHLVAHFIDLPGQIRFQPP